jgi:hypothetical protein
MKQRLVLLSCIIASLLFCADGFAFSTDSVPLHLKLTGLTTQKGPEIYGSQIILSFKPASPARFVGVAFKHEDFTVIHPFMRNDHGVFFCVVPVPTGEREVLYRIVTDGLWMSDPANPDTVPDGRGLRLSRIAIPKEREAKNPIRISRTTARWSLCIKARPGSVSIEGSFNAWDPFMYELSEKTPGSYSIRLRLPEGRHYYRFIINGNPLPDTRNLQRAIDASGREVSEIIIP